MGFTQQPVIIEYVTQKFIDGCYQELTTQTLNLFRSHALLKAQAKDYVRDTQRRLISSALSPKAARHAQRAGCDKIFAESTPSDSTG